MYSFKIKHKMQMLSECYMTPSFHFQQNATRENPFQYLSTFLLLFSIFFDNNGSAILHALLALANMNENTLITMQIIYEHSDQYNILQFLAFV